MSWISRCNRDFEIFLFGGVPESPEATYERDLNTHVSGRLTGRPVSRGILRRPSGGKIVARYVYTPRTGEMRVTPVRDPKGHREKSRVERTE